MHDHSKLNHNLIPNEQIIGDMIDLLKVTADSTRLKILLSLIDGEKNVCCIQELTGKSQSLVSHQLQVLKKQNLVRTRNEQNRVYYAIADDHIQKLLEVVFDHVMEERI